MAITKLILNGVEYDIGNLITVDGPQLYEGREISEYTWEQLKAKCASVDYDDIRVGDYKTITLTGGEIVRMQIAGIDTYYRTTDQNIGHHIDWISKDCLVQTAQWNTTNNNNGVTGVSPNPWTVSNIKKYLNETVYPKLPADVKSVITQKRALIEIRHSDNGPLTDSTGWSWGDVGNLWLPSEYEVFGSVVWGTKGYSGGQHVQYPLFANSYKHRIKGLGDGGNRCTWWLSTVASGHSTACCGVNHHGLATGSYASNSSGVPVCFRITQ